MPRPFPLRIASCGLAAALGLAGCGDTARLPEAASHGAQPQLPAPERSLLPTVNIAPALGWPDGAAPQAAAGLEARVFAEGLEHPRWLLVLPNGDVLVAETNAPPRPGDRRGFMGWAMGKLMTRAGAGVASADRITLLRDADGDGRAELRTPFAEQLRSPFGMALAGEHLYVANTDGIVRYRYRSGMQHVEGAAEPVTDLPAGAINHHWTKNIIATSDGRRLYATVGSNSNVAENGIAAEDGRAAIWEIDLATRGKRMFAQGLRNPNGLAWEPTSGRLWSVVNERDELGSDLVPDYLTSVIEGGFYGWPYSYYGKHVDERIQPPRPDLVAQALVPDYALGNHVAPLGLAWSARAKLPAPFDVEGMFIGEHGSWNRKPHSGYKVVFVPFANGKPAGAPIEVLGGFLSSDGKAFGRPVGVAIDARGALLVADDVGNRIWRVAPSH